MFPGGDVTFYPFILLTSALEGKGPAPVIIIIHPTAEWHPTLTLTPPLLCTWLGGLPQALLILWDLSKLWVMPSQGFGVFALFGLVFMFWFGSTVWPGVPPPPATPAAAQVLRLQICVPQLLAVSITL